MMNRTRHAIRDAVVQQVVPMLPDRRVPAGKDILVVQPDHLGDILLSQPALNLLRSRFPDKRIVAIVGPWSEAIARKAWPADEVRTFPFPAFDRNRVRANPFEPYRMLREATDLISDIQPAVVYVLRPDDWWTATAATMATYAPVYTGVQTGLATHINIPEDIHAAVRAATIAAEGDLFELTPLSLKVDESAGATARQTLAESGISSPHVVIHPGSGADVKLWPARRWRFVARELLDDGIGVVVTGSLAESGLAGSVVEGVDGAVNLAGATPLNLLIEVLRGAAVVAGPDCGPLHLAVATGTPTVHLFGPSDPVRYGPWGDPNRHRAVSAGWSCPCCGDLSPERPAGCGCMLAIEAATVLSTIREMVHRYGHQ